MGSHLYNSTVGRVRWFIKRFGLKEVFLKPIRVHLAPLIIPRLGDREFKFKGQQFHCFYHPYNMTWAGERMVEIPIAKSILDSSNPASTLEVGNVLGHYFPIRHEVVDKFESGTGVINSDILDYRPAKLFELILSISTFEHIGFDDDSPSSSGEKIRGAIQHCRSLLAPDGRLVLTVPTGYNADLDALLASSSLQATDVACLFRIKSRTWVECDLKTALAHPYREKFPYANAIVILQFGPDSNHRLNPP